MIGIDLGSKFIKVCKVANIGKKSDSLSILCAMTSSLGDISTKKNAVLSLLKKLRINNDNDSCYLAVGGKEVINRDVILSKNSGKNLKNAVMLEVEQSITEDLSKMCSAFTITKDISDSECSVLFSAIPKEKLNNKINIVNTIQEITVVGATMESLALVNVFNFFGPDYKNTESIILVNIGHTVSNIVVLNNKDLIFMRDVDFGGKDSTQDISNLYGIPENLAEEVKRRPDLRQNIDFNIRNILKKSTATLVESIFRTIEHCITRQTILSVDRIVITGGGALVEGIDKFIEETLGIPTEKWNPLVGNKITGYANQDYGYFMPVALGLAFEKESDNVYN